MARPMARCMFCPRVVLVGADALSPRLVTCERCAGDTKKDRAHRVKSIHRWKQQQAIERARKAGDG